MNKKAFSFIELIIVVSILSLLGIIAYSANNTVKQNTINTRITADLDTIKNSLVSYKADNEVLPVPSGNLNNFKADSSYSHEGIDEGAFWTFGKITEETLPKKYFSGNLIDSRTKSYYSYGITSDKQFFDVAGVVSKEDYFIAALSGNYRGDGGPVSLIREYNGANFIKDGEATLPYNPYEQVINVTARDNEWKILGVYEANQEIGWFNVDANLYFSDGSISQLSAGWKIKLDPKSFVKENGLITKIELTLNAGTLWTKASRLFTKEEKQESEFQVTTQDTTAAVRGTIFCISEKNDCDGEKVAVAKWEVEVKGGPSAKHIDESKVPEFKLEEKKKRDNDPDKVKELTENTEEEIVGEENEEIKKLEKKAKENSQYCIKIDTGECIVEDFEDDKDYKLVAYAPYDTPGDLKMYVSEKYKKDNNYIDSEKSLKINTPTDSSKDCDRGNAFCMVDGVKGVFIERSGNNGIEYDFSKSKLNLWSDFVIEMRVRGKALKVGNWYLFDFLTNGEDPALKLSIYNNNNNNNNNNKLQFWQNMPSFKSSEIEIGKISDSSFYTIQAIRNVNNLTLKFIDSNWKLLDDDTEDNVSHVLTNTLFIGSERKKSGKVSNQLNDIIDYVKIYKK